VFCAAAAGVQVLSAEALASAKSLITAADVNAVPPAGIEGLELHGQWCRTAGGILGIGPLAIGDVKYKTESGLFRRLATSSAHLAIDFRDAFALAREIG
jgi:methylene-tetrahydromethanopterin dehydrogenase